MNKDLKINQRIATKAIIINSDKKILILREADTYEEGTNHGRYHCPGGRLNPGEPYLDGLQREVSEETGLIVSIGEPVFVGEWFPTIKGIPNQIVAIFFLCKPLTTDITLSEEHNDYKWITFEELSDYDIMSPEPEAITIAYKKLK